MLLRLIKGVVTLDLNDGTNYGIPSDESGEWIPAVAAKNRSQLASGPYLDVWEEIPVHVRGATGAAALANLRVLVEILDEVNSWRLGENITPLVLQYAPTNSSLSTPYAQAIVKDVDEATMIRLSAINRATNNEIPGIVLRIKRGQWLGDENTPSASSTLANPNIMSVTFSETVNVPSPVELVLDGFSGAGVVTNYLLVARLAAHLAIEEGEDGVSNLSAGTWTAPADSGKNPRGGNIGRFTAADTNWQSVFYGPMGLSGRELAIIAAVRVNSASYTWQIKAQSLNLSGGSVNGETRPITLAYNEGKPQLVMLGSISSVVNTHDVIYLYFKVDDATGSPTLDVDYLAFIIMDGDCNHVIRVVPASFLSGNFELRYDHRLLENPEPTIMFEVGATVAPMGYDSPPIIYSRGTNLSAIWLSTYDDQWVHTNTAKSAVSSLNITGTRRIAYLTPP